MTRLTRFLLGLSALLLLLAAPLLAESKDTADYPLRLHIFTSRQTVWYYGKLEDGVKGQGRGNLFEEDDVHGVDFTFECSQDIKNSMSGDTYPARWKKPDQELVVLMPVFGKTGDYFTCTIKTDVKKDFVYRRTQNGLIQQPSTVFKAWMVDHNYDPVHGKNVPMKSPSQPDSQPASQPASQSGSQQGTQPIGIR